jgi:hypothetical protein
MPNGIVQVSHIDNYQPIINAVKNRPHEVMAAIVMILMSARAGRYYPERSPLLVDSGSQDTNHFQYHRINVR